MNALALSVAGGPRMAGAFMRNVQVRAVSPASGGTNTSGTVQFQAVLLDPLRRGGAILFYTDVSTLYNSAYAQTSSAVTGTGWADVPISWTSTVMVNRQYVWQCRSTLVKVGAGPSVPNGRLSTAITFSQAGGAGIPRSLYLHANRSIQSVVAGVGSNARSLYLGENRSVQVVTAGVASASRGLYLAVNRVNAVIPAGLSRALYVAHSVRDGEVFPWLMKIDPTEQYVGGQVSIFGDGLGQYLDATQSATLSSSTVYSTNVATNIRDGTASEWASSAGASSWIRFTWGSAKRIVAVVLDPGTLGSWGVPRFKFDDASQQDGTTLSAYVANRHTGEYPVGIARTAYWLATPKVSTYVEVAIASGGSGTNRGLMEAWIIEEVVPQENAETSRVWLNLDLPTVTDMGIVTWSNRSSGLHPANSGNPILAAGIVTVPATAVSGLVTVQEET